MGLPTMIRAELLSEEREGIRITSKITIKRVASPRVVIVIVLLILISSSGLTPEMPNRGWWPDESFPTRAAPRDSAPPPRELLRAHRRSTPTRRSRPPSLLRG